MELKVRNTLQNMVAGAANPFNGIESSIGDLAKPPKIPPAQNPFNGIERALAVAVYIAVWRESIQWN
jgi:hypothetical protein